MAHQVAVPIRPVLPRAITPIAALAQPHNADHCGVANHSKLQSVTPTAVFLLHVSLSENSIGELFVSLKPKVAGIIRALLGQPPTFELVHDICVDAAMAAASFRGESAFSSWLYAVVGRRVRRWIRTESHRRSLLRAVVDAWPMPTPVQPDAAVSGYRLAAQLSRALQALPTRQRTCFTLVQFDDRPVNEVAELLKITPEAVRMNILRAKRRLRLWVQTRFPHARLDHQTRARKYRSRRLGL